MDQEMEAPAGGAAGGAAADADIGTVHRRVMGGQPAGPAPRTSDLAGLRARIAAIATDGRRGGGGEGARGGRGRGGRGKQSQADAGAAGAAPSAPARGGGGGSSLIVTRDEFPSWPQEGLEEFTDLGNAQRMARLIGQDLMYVPETEDWYVWTGTHWERDAGGTVYRLGAEAVVRDLYGLAADLDRAAGDARRQKDEERAATLTSAADQARKWALSTQSGRRMQYLVDLAADDPRLQASVRELDRDPMLLACRNGVVDLSTGELRPARREDRITRRIEIDYNPDAKAPRWERFLREVFAGDEELIAWLQRAVGYSITGRVDADIVIIAWGSGSNGKSTLLRTLLRIVGPYGLTLPPDLLLERRLDSHPTGLADLRGVRLAAAIETPEGARLNEPLIKALSGGDEIAARRLYRDYFRFSPTHKLWLATNHRPVVRGMDHAIWRRLRLVPFRVRFRSADEPGDGPVKDDHLRETLASEEAQGILAWIVAGAVEWARHGLGKEPPAVLAATEEYRHESDQLARWLEDAAVTGPGRWARAQDAYASYIRWCDANGERALSNQQFRQRLEERGYRRTRRHGGQWWWQGFGLIDEGASGDGDDEEGAAPAGALGVSDETMSYVLFWREATDGAEPDLF